MSSDILQLIKNAISEGFDAIAYIIRRFSPQEIVVAAAQSINASPQEIAAFPMGGFSKNRKSGAYYFVLEDMKANISKFAWLNSRLEDDASREVLKNLMLYRLFPDMEFIKKAYDAVNPQYFDKSIVSTDENEVFVDCGGYIGDTVQSYITHCGAYKHIYVYEPSAENMPVCRENLSEYPGITLRQAGVGEQNTVLAYSEAGSAGTFMQIFSGSKSELTEIVSLDEDISEPVTFIKMDVEGFEEGALNGAKRHIREDKPKLAVCLYHIISDLWEIPQLIHSIEPDYRYYLRHYCDEQTWETVLYAIPVDKGRPDSPDTIFAGKQGKDVGVWAPCSQFLSWKNHELLKDCGLAPYMFNKVYGYKATMLGCKDGEYPYLDLLPGLRMEFLPDCAGYDEHLAENIRYLKTHYNEMDILVLYGAYPYYQKYLSEYRKLRPDGKVYMALDANCVWMDRTDWTYPGFAAMLDACDVIATSCRKMWRHLNRKWNRWTINYIPNGFYNPTGADLSVTYDQKENILLTVGRLGTEQKANHVLLEAFASVSAELADWRVHLAGAIEESFNPYIDEYFRKYPELRERVVFKGIIEDKNDLYAEYARAKIFILTSTFEGAPNVIAEALYHGCYQITSEVDAAEDITNCGDIGRSFPIGDVGALSAILREVCRDETLLKDAFPRILTYAKDNFDWEVIIKRLHHMLAGI